MNKTYPSFCLALVLFVLPFGKGFGFSGGSQPVSQASPSLPVPFKAQLLSTAETGCGGVAVPAISEEYEQQVVELVNVERSGQGLPPLKWNPSLTEAARYHAADLGQDDYFDHDSYDRDGEQLVLVCDTWSRVASYYTGANAENIAGGYATPEEVMQGWMESPGHRTNILNPDSWEIGVGYFTGAGEFPEYWVQDFGKTSGVYPLVINGEAVSTASPSVSIYIYGDWQEMRLRNEAGSWTAWQPFQSESDWTLNSDAGEHTVYVQLRDGSQSASSSDTIILTGESEKREAPVLGDLPDEIKFTFSIPDQRIFPPFHQLTPGLENGREPLIWKVQSDGNFFTATPFQGATPDPVTIMPTSFDLGLPGTYSGALTLTIIDPVGVEGSPQTIEVILEVVDTEIYNTFLPGIQN